MRSVDKRGRQVLVERQLAAAWAVCGTPLAARRRQFDAVEIAVTAAALLVLGFLAGAYVGLGWLCHP